MADDSIAFGVAVCGAALLACAAGPKAGPTTIDEYGYKHTEYAYRVLHDGSAQGSVTRGLMDGDWLLDNLYPKGNELLPKESAEYLTSYSFDNDGDGDVDSREQGFLYDLRFKHRTRDGIVFIRTLPISGDLRDKDLRVLVQRYIDGVSGAGYEAVQLQGQTVVTEQRFAADVQQRGSARLAGQEAYQATFDVANVDQLKLSPNARRTRVRIVFARTPFQHEVGKGPGRPKGTMYPVMLVSGYANLPEDFDRDLPAFTKLLGRIQIGTSTGFNAEAGEVQQPAPAGSTSAPAAPASPPLPVPAASDVPPAAPTPSSG